MSKQIPLKLAVPVLRREGPRIRKRTKASERIAKNPRISLYCTMTDNENDLQFNALIEILQNEGFNVLQRCNLCRYPLDDDLRRAAFFTIIDSIMGQGASLGGRVASVRVYDFPDNQGLAFRGGYRYVALACTSSFSIAILAFGPIRTNAINDRPTLFRSRDGRSSSSSLGSD